MPGKKKLLFTIDDTTPETLPMERLADYLKQLAVLMGSTDKVHFMQVEDGSAACAILADEVEEPRIVERIEQIKKGKGPKEALEAHRTLHEMLIRDNRPAELELADGNVVLDFPLPSNDEQETYGPFWEDGSLDGMLIMIGGKDETVPVHLLDDGKFHKCNASRELAKDLSPFLFRHAIRVHGRGKWFRNVHGRWEMTWFNIDRFEDLDNSSLPEVVSRLRAIPGNDLTSLDDPLAEMRKIRHGK